MGWEVPGDFEEFVTLCKTIEKSGIRSIQLGFANPEVLDTAFVGYSCGTCYSRPSDMVWIENYNKGIGSFGEQFSPALDTFQRLIDEGIWKEQDLHIEYSARELMLFNRECAMVEDSVLLARIGHGLAGSTDEFGLMPFFNPGSDSDWARLYMVCYIGMNKHLEEPENKENFSLTDTGNFVTDAIRKKAGSDIALFLDNGKDGRYNNRGIAAKLYKGELSVNDIDRIINDLKMGERMVLWKGTIKGENLLKTLEYAVPTDNHVTGWFYYFSGLKLKFAPAADPGSRVKSISLADGEKLDPEKVYTIAAMEDTIPEEYLISCEKTDMTIYDILREEISSEQTISPAKDGRFEIANP